MKKLLYFVFLLFCGTLVAQPAYDDCGGIFDLGVAPACPENMLFNNVDATESDIGFDNFPPCFNGGNPQRDVWFSFIASDTIFDYTVTLTGCPDPDNGFASIINPQIAVYRGDCEFDGLQLLDCVSADADETTVKINLDGLTPGITYFLRINDWSASATPNWGAFKLCVKEKDPIVIIGEEDFTDDCFGEIFDSGGPDEDYSNNENFTFTICPSDFHNCLNFSLEFFNLEENGDGLTFFDGDDTSAPQIGAVGGSGFGGGINDGGVCYSVAATSGCLTIQFTSNGSSTFEGFHGFWECSQAECDPIEPITVDTNIDADDIVENISTPTTIVTVDTILCPDGAIGTFNADNSDLGLEKGLIITSGQATNAIGPNTLGGAGTANPPNINDGDDDLDYLSTLSGNGSPSRDACIIELEVFAATDELTFEYVFGSEEYPEFVNSNFNDIFAFLISGPGIDGDANIDNQLNIATLPDGTFVQINSVNNNANWEYYRNNQVPFGAGPNFSAGQSVQYDGLTSDFLGVKKSLTARADVIPCNTYNLKLAVADRQDEILDSGVFISELKGGTPSIGVQYFSGIEYLVEDCTAVPDQILIELGSEQEDTTTFTVVIGGTAEIDVDYTLDIPSQIILLPGETQISFPIMPLSDGIPEGIETIELQLTNDFGCGTVVFSTLVIELHDNLEVEIFAGADTVFVCENTCINMEVAGAQNYFWTPPGLFDDPNSATPEFCPPTSQFVEVLGTLGVCSDMDTIYAEVVAPEVTIDPLDVTNICIGDSVTMVAVNNVGNSNLQWTPAIGLSDPNAQTVEAEPQVNTDYIATVELAGCTASDTITINVDLFDFPNLTTLDTTICQNFSVTMADPIPGTTTNFEWQSNPSDPSMTCTDCPDPVVTPDVSTIYTLTASSENDYCSVTTEIDIEVIPADIEILNPDTLEICLGDTVTLNSIVSNDGSGFTWSPEEGLDNAAELITIANPTQTTNYFASLTIGGCTVIDSVLIYVDSLPDLAISAIPEKESYCIGEEILLVSDIYEPANFPNIDHLWDPLLGVQTPDSNLNLVLNAFETTTYVRTTTNRGCTSIDSIEIVVVPATSITLMPADTVVCPGEPVQMMLMIEDGVEEIMWDPSDVLSCTDCLDPIATVSTTTSINVNAEFDGCPLGTSATIEIQNPPALTFPADTDLCNGESIVLNTAPDPGNTYEWSGTDGTSSTDPAPEVTPTGDVTYTVTADNGICTVTLDLMVNVYNNPLYEFPASPIICSDETIVLNNTVDPNAVYIWTDENGEVVSTSANPEVSPNGTTTYTLDVSNPGCMLMDAITIQVNEAPAFQFSGETEICEGDEVTLNSATATPGATYTWTGDNGFSSSDPNPTDIPTGNTVYTLVATNAPCEISQTISINVTQDIEIAILGAMDICQGESLTLMGDAGQNIGTFSWSDNTGVISSESDITVEPSATTNYVLEFDTDANCDFFPATAAATVNVNESLTVEEAFILVGEDTLVVNISGNTGNIGSELIEGQNVDIVLVLSDGTVQQLNWFENGTAIAGASGLSINEIIPSVTLGSSVQYSVDIISGDLCESTFLLNINIEENVVQIPNAFTPNGDDVNNIFRLVSEVPVEVLDMRIYNRWGQTVFEDQNFTSDNGWDGMHDGDPAEPEVYIYYFLYRKGETTIGPVKGDVTLIR